MIRTIKRGYDAITKEHMIIFLIFFTAIILFNSLDFGYTGLAARQIENCEDCNEITGAGFWGDFLDLFKRDVRGSGPGAGVPNAELLLREVSPSGNVNVGLRIQLPPMDSGGFSAGQLIWSTDAHQSYNVCSVSGNVLETNGVGNCVLRVGYDIDGYGEIDGGYDSYTLIVQRDVNAGSKIATECAGRNRLDLPETYSYKGTGKFDNEQLKKFDADGNGKIDDGDFNLFCNAYCTYDSKYDFTSIVYPKDWNGLDCRGRVDVYDYTELIYAWGMSYSTGGTTGATGKCTGTADTNAANLCSGDDAVTGTQDVAVSYVASGGCTSIKKCEYECKSTHELKIVNNVNTCALKTGAGGGAGTGGTGGTGGGTTGTMGAGNVQPLSGADVVIGNIVDENGAASNVNCGSGKRISELQAYYFCPDNSGRAVACPIANTGGAGLQNGGVGQGTAGYIFGNSICVDSSHPDPCSGMQKQGKLIAKCSVGNVIIDNVDTYEVIPTSYGLDVKLDGSNAILKWVDVFYNPEIDLTKVDVVKNNVIDYEDYFAFAAAFESVNAADILRFDFNNDGKVNRGDYRIWELSLGKNVAAGGTGNAVAGFAVLDNDYGLWERIKSFFRGLFGGEAVGAKINLGEVIGERAKYRIYVKNGAGNFGKVEDRIASGATGLCVKGECSYSNALTLPGSYTYKVVALVDGNEIAGSEKTSLTAVEYLVVGLDIKHDAITTGVLNRDLSLTANGKGEFNYLELNYKIAGESAYTQKNFTMGDLIANDYRSYNVVIPAARVVGNIEYNIIAKNANGVELKKIGPYVVNVNLLKENCEGSGDADGDGVVALLDKDCGGKGGYVGVKTISVSDEGPYANMSIDVTCEINVAKASVENVASSKCVKARIGGNECGVSPSVSGSNLIFNGCDSGDEGKKDVSCYVDFNKCNVDELSNRVNAKKNISIEVINPDICEDGVLGGGFASLSNLKTDKSSYNVGERIKVNVDVSAKGEDLDDAVVKAVVYDVEDEDKPAISEGESEPLNIRKGQRKGFTIYVDTGKEDYKNEHKVFVALQVDEPEVCVYASKDLRLKRASNETTTTTIYGGCVTGQTRVCGNDIGVCKKGLQNCVGGVWGACAGEVKGSREVCADNLDNDCNGNVDCDDIGCGNYAGCKLVPPVDATRDDDQDGLPDSWERKYFDSEELYNADDDSDDDGFTNIKEYVGGSDPSDPDSVPEESSFKLIFFILGILLVIVILAFVVFKYMKKPKQLRVQIPKKEENGRSNNENKSKIDEYVKHSLEKGYNPGQVKTALAIKGWTKAEIDEAFKRVE